MSNYIYKTSGRYQEWYVDGKLHRLDGPAYINGGYKEWWVDGRQMIKKEFDNLVQS